MSLKFTVIIYLTRINGRYFYPNLISWCQYKDWLSLSLAVKNMPALIVQHFNSLKRPHHLLYLCLPAWDPRGKNSVYLFEPRLKQTCQPFNLPRKLHLCLHFWISWRTILYLIHLFYYYANQNFLHFFSRSNQIYVSFSILG